MASLALNRQESVELFERLTSEKYFGYTEKCSIHGESFRLTDHLTKKEGAVEVIIGSVAGVVVGAVATKLITGVASSAGTVLYGVAKEVIKGGLVIQEAASGMWSEGGNYFSDLVAEAKAELATTPTGKTMRAKAHATS